MRTRKLPYPADALPACETVLKQTRAVRAFRRPHAVRAVVTGSSLQPVSDTRDGFDCRVGPWGAHSITSPCVPAACLRCCDTGASPGENWGGRRDDRGG